MKIRLLPSNVINPKKQQSLTSFLVDDSVAIDGGSLGFAEDSKHLTPEILSAELRNLKRTVQVFAVHLKPPYEQRIAQQLRELGCSNLCVSEIDRDYRFASP